MVSIVQIFAAAALLGQLTSATDCSGDGSCTNLHDETSLLQLNKADAVQRGQAMEPEDATEENVPHSEKVRKTDVEGRDAELGEDLYSEGEAQAVNSTGSEAVCMNSKYMRIQGGQYYRRGSAPKAKLGAYGDLKDCFTCSYLMEFKGWKKEWLEPVQTAVQIETKVTLSSSQTNEFSSSAKAAASTGAVTASGNVGASGSGSGSDSFKAVLMSFSSEDALIAKINADKGALKALHRYANPRVVNAIIKLESAMDTADQRCMSGNGGASASDATGKASGELSASATACSQMTASFAAGTTLAYQFSKVKFDSKGEVVGLDIDPPCSYFNPTCGCNIFK